MARKDGETAGEIALTGLWWAPQRVAPVRSFPSTLLPALPGLRPCADTSPLGLLFFPDPSTKSLLLQCPLRHKKDLPLTCDNHCALIPYPLLGIIPQTFGLPVRANICMVVEEKTFVTIRTKFCIIC